MASRKVSDSVYYPVIDTPWAFAQDTAKAIRDIFIIIQGTPDFEDQPPVVEPYVGIRSIGDIGIDKILTFWAFKGTDKWEFSITVAHSQGIVEVATDHPYIHAVMIIDTDVISPMAWSADASDTPIEPSRVLWYDDQVNSVEIRNIRRLNGIEEPEEERLVAVFAPTPGNPLALKFGPGYNTEWFVDSDDSLTLNVSEGGGKGRVQNYGDTVPGGTPLPDIAGLIYNINGLNPIDGDIPLITTDSIGLETETGKITVVIRQ